MMLQLALRPLATAAVFGTLLWGAASGQQEAQNPMSRFLTGLKSTLFVPNQQGAGRARFCESIKSLNGDLAELGTSATELNACHRSLAEIEKNYCSESCSPPAVLLTKEIWWSPGYCDEKIAFEAWKSCLGSYEGLAALEAPASSHRAVSSVPAPPESKEKH